MIENVSSFPDTEVWPLLRFASSGFNPNDVYFKVADYTAGPYMGVAYDRIPQREDDWQKYFGYKYFVYLGINPNAEYPVSNLWRIATPGEDLSDQVIRVVNRQLFVRENQEPDYPEITCSDWKEMLVKLTAHELAHIADYRADRATSEVGCETYAASVLSNFRNRNHLVAV
jgi:hypothetical protein